MHGPGGVDGFSFAYGGYSGTPVGLLSFVRVCLCTRVASVDDATKMQKKSFSDVSSSRYALPNSRVMVHQPSGGAQGMASDIKIQAEEILKVRSRLNELYVGHSE